MVAILKMPLPAFMRAASDTNDSGPLGSIGAQPAPSENGAERRMFRRKEVHAHIQGKRMDHTISARREPHLALSLRDLSMGGLSAISQSPVESGERVSVYFPPQGIQRGWDAIGRVIRCTPSGMGYRIAVEFDPLPMAA